MNSNRLCVCCASYVPHVCNPFALRSLARDAPRRCDVKLPKGAADQLQSGRHNRGRGLRWERHKGSGECGVKPDLATGRKSSLLFASVKQWRNVDQAYMHIHDSSRRHERRAGREVRPGHSRIYPARPKVPHCGVIGRRTMHVASALPTGLLRQANVSYAQFPTRKARNLACRLCVTNEALFLY